jgi:hypothetical protein
MIPKIIHYCWLSNDPIPADLLKYIDTWKEKLPDYKIMKWDFSVFEKSSSAWVSQAFDNKKYAFAADFIRLYAVYHYGGIYLDSDVEVLKSFDPYLQLPTMIGWQYNKDGLEVAAFGAEKEQAWIGDCLDYYKDRTFVKSDGSFDQNTLPLIVEDVLKSHHYQLIDVHNIQEAEEVKGEKDIPVFTTDYFSPKSAEGVITLTENTVSIHHFAASWTSPTHRFIRKMVLLIGGPKLKRFASRIYALIHKS